MPASLPKSNELVRPKRNIPPLPPRKIVAKRIEASIEARAEAPPDSHCSFALSAAAGAVQAVRQRIGGNDAAAIPPHGNFIKLKWNYKRGDDQRGGQAEDLLQFSNWLCRRGPLGEINREAQVVTYCLYQNPAASTA
jgi:hypothetical protein